MPVTEIRGRQVLDTDIGREDLNTTTTGRAVLTKLIAGTNIGISYTGTDAGTGDVTVNLLGTIPISIGGTGVTSVTTSPTISAWAGWDANKNLFASNLIDGYTTTATAAGTTTLTVASTYLQYFTGITTQTVVLPVATTLVNGQQFMINNNSTGVVTVQTSGGNVIQALPASTYLLVTCINTAGGTGTASWNWNYDSMNSTPISVPMGGTGFASYTIGDILYANSTTTLAKLVDVATGNALISGGVGVTPSYGKIGLTTHISGTLAVGNGGTGATTLIGLIKGNGTSAFTAAVAGTDYAAAAATFTLGSTSIALGSTTTTVAGLSSVTSTTFIGALTGTASNATTWNTYSLDISTTYGTGFDYIFARTTASSQGRLITAAGLATFLSGSTMNIVGSASTVTGAAQTAITSVGTLTSLNVTGSLSSGNITSTNGTYTLQLNTSGSYSAPSLLATSSTDNLFISPNGRNTYVGGNGVGYAATLSVRNASSGNTAFSVEDNTASTQWFKIDNAGKITVGTWNASVIGAAYGGTGLSTLTSNYLYKGNGTSAMVASGISDNGTSVTVARELIISGSYAGSQGSIAFAGGSGLFITGKTGTTYDLSLANASGGAALQIPTGTTNITLLGILSGTSATFSGNTGIQISNATQTLLRLTNPTATTGQDFALSSSSTGHLLIGVYGVSNIIDINGSTQGVIFSSTINSGAITSTGIIIGTNGQFGGYGSTTASVSAYSKTNGSYTSAIRMIENTFASSYWDMGVTGGASPILNFYQNGSAAQVTFTTTNVNILYSTTSTSTSTGSLVVSGGIGAAGSIFSGGSGNFTTKVVNAGPYIENRTGNLGDVVAMSLNTLDAAAGSTSIQFGAYGSGNALTQGVKLKAVYNYGGFNSTSFVLQTTTTAGTLTDALTISETQQVNVLASTASTSTSTGALIVSGGVGIGGAVYVGGNMNAPAFINTSDLAFKNIVSRDGDVVYFTWKSGNNGLRTGYIAQEVLQWMPNAVSGTEGSYAVNYIEVHTQKIRTLERRIAELEKLLRV